MSDAAHLLLMAVIAGEQVAPNAECELELATSGETVPADRDAFDSLEDAGWIEVHAGGVRATERGRYWAQKWVRKHFGVRDFHCVRVTARRAA